MKTEDSSMEAMAQNEERSNEEVKDESPESSFKEEKQIMLSVTSNSLAGGSTHVEDEETSMRQELYSQHQPSTLCSTDRNYCSTHFVPADAAKQSRNYFFTVHSYSSLREFFD